MIKSLFESWMFHLIVRLILVWCSFDGSNRKTTEKSSSTDKLVNTQTRVGHLVETLKFGFEREVVSCQNELNTASDRVTIKSGQSSIESIIKMSGQGFWYIFMFIFFFNLIFNFLTFRYNKIWNIAWMWVQLKIHTYCNKWPFNKTKCRPSGARPELKRWDFSHSMIPDLFDDSFEEELSSIFCLFYFWFSVVQISHMKFWFYHKDRSPSANCHFCCSIVCVWCKNHSNEHVACVDFVHTNALSNLNIEQEKMANWQSQPGSLKFLSI